MNFKVIKFGLTLLSAILVMAGVSVIFYAGAYMQGGHPPASGIYALIAVLVAGMTLLEIHDIKGVNRQ